MFQEFDDLLAALGPEISHESDLAVAVSGGPDSVALAHMLSSWGKAHKKTIHVLCVDHGLRPESALEAQSVVRRVSSWPYVRAQILKWEHAEVGSRIQEEARAARYGLMAAYCHAHNIKFLFLAHHQDDQAETLLFRLAKGSGLDGLAGMQNIQTYDDRLALVRPFLSWPKSVLLEYCQANGMDYFSDPANDSDLFARARLRKSFAVLEAEGLTASRLSVTAKRLARARDSLDFFAENIYEASTSKFNPKHIGLNFEVFKKYPEEILIRCVLKAMNILVPFTAYRPRLEKIEDLCGDLLKSDAFRKRTLGGVIFERDDDCKTLILTIEHEEAKN